VLLSRTHCSDSLRENAVSFQHFLEQSDKTSDLFLKFAEVRENHQMLSKLFQQPSMPMLFQLPGKRLMLCQIHLLPLNGLMISKRELIKCKRLLVKPTSEEVVSGMVVFLPQKLISLHLNNQQLNSISSLLKSLSSNLNSTQAMPKKTKHAQTNLALSSTVYQSNQLNTTPSTRELSFLTSFNQLFQPSTCNGSTEKLPLRAKMLIKSSLSFQFT